VTAPIPPIGVQISALARIAPDEPAVSSDGRTITRAELDTSTNRLARAYAERGVGVGGTGDYVTIALPNSIEWVQAAVACWKLGAVPQPLSPRLPDAEFEGLLQLKPRALLVGRSSPGTPSVPAGFVPDPGLSDAALPEAVSPCWKSLASGGSTDPNDGDLGQVPYALVHTADGSTLDTAAVQQFLRGRIETYKVPRVVEFVSNPLRDDAGKARRSAVRDEIIARLRSGEDR
jgi:acyl-CoA synthetase (AMP-forming)/AMP-acid ligase II